MTRRKIGNGAGLLLAGLLGCAGCKSVDRFDTVPGGAYCGEMLGGPVVSDGLIPDGSATRLKLALTLSTQQLQSYPG